MSRDILYFIGKPGHAEAMTAALAGSKAALLGRMSQLGLNVPPAFVLPATLCAAVNRGDPAGLEAVERALRDGISWLEQTTGRRFGDSRMPLLVSVRSGAEKSMPGMLSTVLDVGMNNVSVHGLIAQSGNPRLAWDCYRRFIQMYAEVVGGASQASFDAALMEIMRGEAVASESDLDCEALERLTHSFRTIAMRETGGIPKAPAEQLFAATQAVYRSWESPRAQEYRQLNRLDGLIGTAVTVQAMVYGNTGGRSGAGVAFSRDPATGAKDLYVDFLSDAQGEDVVSGRRAPNGLNALAARLPVAAKELSEGAARLERELGDVQDIEFTIEDGKLFFLQTRAAKRTPRAALRILVDLVREGVIDRATAAARATQIDTEAARLTRFTTDVPAIGKAISAAPGVASGRAVFDSTRAKIMATDGVPVILIRHDTSTEDIGGFAVAAGILTATGGRTAHAAVVARQLGKVCLVACRDLTIDADARCAQLGGHPLKEGDWLSLDGDRAEVSLGRREIISELPTAELAEIAAWRRCADEAKAIV
ncbi:MAG TPA: PEP/pyruvate-binding domain-containing protein [Stellaceae bacterium]|jgi:pyruvate,orthophosphate dikinase|nr:PEP/pyruvate-binding domain-containing protein [Stellaceae bacterium]